MTIFDQGADGRVNLVSDHPLAQGLRPLEILGEVPLGFIDIGARGDLHPVVAPLARHTAVLGFEPDARECARMNQLADRPWSQFEVLPVALAASSGPRDFYCYSAPTNDSLLPPDRGFCERYDVHTMKLKEKRNISCETLDKILSRVESPIPWGEFIKVDTQGTELEIFQGADWTLRNRAVAIICEVEMAPQYEAQALFAEVEQFLRGYGFSFYSFTDMNYRAKGGIKSQNSISRERIHWCDAVFFKDPLPGGAAKAQPLTERQAACLFFSAVLLGYFDFGREVASFFWPESSDRMTQLLRDLAYVDPADVKAKLEKALAAVSADPSRAAIALADLRDASAFWPDFGDIRSREGRTL